MRGTRGPISERPSDHVRERVERELRRPVRLSVEPTGIRDRRTSAAWSLAQLVRERLYLKEAGAREKGDEGMQTTRLEAFSDAVIARITPSSIRRHPDVTVTHPRKMPSS